MRNFNRTGHNKLKLYSNIISKYQIANIRSIKLFLKLWRRSIRNTNYRNLFILALMCATFFIANLSCFQFQSIIDLLFFVFGFNTYRVPNKQLAFAETKNLGFNLQITRNTTNIYVFFIYFLKGNTYYTENSEGKKTSLTLEKFEKLILNNTCIKIMVDNFTNSFIIRDNGELVWRNPQNPLFTENKHVVNLQADEIIYVPLGKGTFQLIIDCE